MKKKIIFLLVYLFLFSPNFISTELKRKDFYCIWTTGSNMWYQLGVDRHNCYENIPIQVFGIDDIIEISAGSSSKILKSDGTVWAWGYNGSCNFGNGTDRNSYFPVQSNIDNVISISDGLALKNDGTVWVIGHWDCQHFPNYKFPIQVQGLNDIIGISDYSIVLKNDGTVWDIDRNKITFAQVPNLSDIIAISQKGSRLALKNDGIVLQWYRESEPTQVPNLENVIAISAGAGYLDMDTSKYYTFSICLKNDETVWAWGWNKYGQLGNGTNNDSDVPVQVLNLTDVIAISAGAEHCLALKEDGTVWAWGKNASGQLGNGTNVDSNVPVQVENLSNVIKISAGNNYSLALKEDGTLWAWGSNDYGQLGNGDGYDTDDAIPILDLYSIISVDAGAFHNLALKSDGTVWAWGCDLDGELGNGTCYTRFYPVQTQIEDVKKVSAGGSHSLALKEKGTVWAWGLNEYGQLGNGTWVYCFNIPTQVLNLKDVIEISAGFNHSIALKDDRFVWAWGWNEYGQLGNGTNLDSNVPVQISNLSNIIKVSAGGDFSFALKEDGTVWAWGWNKYGQLGIGNFQDINIPVRISNIKNPIFFSGGYAHSILLAPFPYISIETK